MDGDAVAVLPNYVNPMEYKIEVAGKLKVKGETPKKTPATLREQGQLIQKIYSLWG